MIDAGDGKVETRKGTKYTYSQFSRGLIEVGRGDTGMKMDQNQDKGRKFKTRETQDPLEQMTVSVLKCPSQHSKLLRLPRWLFHPPLLFHSSCLFYHSHI